MSSVAAASAISTETAADDVRAARAAMIRAILAGDAWPNNSCPDQQDRNGRDQAKPDQRRNWHIHKNEASLEPAARVSATKVRAHVGLIMHDHSRCAHRRRMGRIASFSPLLPPGGNKHDDREQAQPGDLGHSDRVQDTHELPPCHPLPAIFLPQSGRDSEGSGFHRVRLRPELRSFTPKIPAIRADISMVALSGQLSFRGVRMDPGSVFGPVTGDPDVTAAFRLAQGFAASTAKQQLHAADQSRNAEIYQQAKRQASINIHVLNPLASS